ncbi:hypothetical protein P5673_000335 [Acropora cervicornis]|uniref:DUF7041 domain-containing protein n=1 Tax=Acropora cervicornis TaxID=6130 RepID=A0AAD9R6Z6_ACRCE|nr:hypothetical protein P5673_000335 [Acropora cervicornis]
MFLERPLKTYGKTVSLKLPDFWPSDPELRFAQAEALFTAQNVTQEKTKFGHVVRVLPARYASESPEQPYEAELTKRVCTLKRQRLQQLLHVEDLGNRKPPQLLRYMLKLRGDAVLDADRDEIFRELFLQKLPITIRTALATHKDATHSARRDGGRHGRGSRPLTTSLSGSERKLPRNYSHTV